MAFACVSHVRALAAAASRALAQLIHHEDGAKALRDNRADQVAIDDRDHARPLVLPQQRIVTRRANSAEQVQPCLGYAYKHDTDLTSRIAANITKLPALLCGRDREKFHSKTGMQGYIFFFCQHDAFLQRLEE